MSAVTKVQDSVVAQAEHWQTRRKREIEELRAFINECDLSEMFQKFLEKKKKPLLHPSGDGGDGGDDADPEGDDNDEERGNLTVMYQGETGTVKKAVLQVFFEDDDWEIVRMMLRGHLRLNPSVVITFFEEPNGEVLDDDGMIPLYEYATGNNETIYATIDQHIHNDEPFITVFIRIASKDTTESITVLENETVAMIKQILSGRFDIWWGDINIRKSDIILEDEMEAKDIGEGLLHFLIKGRGGGKRAHSAVKASNASKDERLKSIRDNIMMTTLRFDNAQKAPSITTISGKFKQLIDLCNNKGDKAFSDALTTMSKDEISKVIKAIGTTNNAKTRLKAIKDVIFKGDWVEMSELKTQIEMVEKSCLDCVELMLTSQYGDDAGSIGWLGLMDEMTKKISG